MFIEVALTKSILGSMRPIVEHVTFPEKEATTAIFYAIVSTQDGLSGVDLGNLLIKRVVQRIQSELPRLFSPFLFSSFPFPIIQTHPLRSLYLDSS